jgi:hypothetical protein
MKRLTATCQLGPTSATVMTNHPAVVDHLREFYTVRDGAENREWLIEAMVGPPDESVITNPWGVSYLPFKGGVRLRARHWRTLAITTRKCVREALIDYCERHRYVMLHASAFADDDRVVIVVGDKGSGKTTLALKAALRNGMRYLSNDHLIAYVAERPTDITGLATRLAVTSLPTPIPLKIGTYLDLEPSLPPPWDTEGLDIEAYRKVPRHQLYGVDQRVLYTFSRLGQESPTIVRLGDVGTGPAVLMVLASYDNQAEMDVTPVSDPVAALMAHVRTDWMFSRLLNQRHLLRHERDRRRYIGDARRLVTALAERASVVAWRHNGDPAPLLDLPISAWRAS